MMDTTNKFMVSQKSEFLKAFGFVLECWKAIVDAVLSLGGGDDDLRRIVTESGLAVKIARVIMDSVKPATETVVSKWQELLTACRQCWIDPYFTEAGWPLEPVAVDEADWEVGEHFFSEKITGTEGLRSLAKMENRGEICICGVRRSMEDTADHLDIQIDHPRIIPVSAQFSNGSLYLPVFSRYWSVSVHGRRLDLCVVSNDFSPDCGWLVLRKKKKSL
jgi:hypothetical protein